ncbi:MAG TPA: two-component regulator propeller domain-containing protein [Opitutaceae bacterium]|nr:two-component regulator propeller domain-containing protein [Opitutaceae bacterium]
MNLPRLLLVAGAGALLAPAARALDPHENPANYIASHWDVENGLPHNAVKQLFQSRDGYLWVGTNYGLARFDGLSFTVFTKSNTPGIPNNQITSITEMPDGSLWFGTADGVVRYREGQFTAYSMADGLKSRTINSVCPAPDGSLWLGGQKGITRWVAGKFVNDIDLSDNDLLGLRAIAADRRGAMWISAGAAVLRYQQGRLTRFGRAEGIASDRVQRVCEDPAGRILAVTQNGLYRLDGERFVPFELNEALSSRQISTATVDRSGNLWVGSVRGIDRVYEDKAEHYADRYGNTLGVGDALLEDREGCLWVGTSEGLYRLSNRRAYSLTSEQGIGDELVSAVLQTRDGSIWIGGWSSGITRIQNDTVTHYLDSGVLSREAATKIYEAPDGSIWFGNRGSAIDHLVDGKATSYVYAPGVPTSRPVTALLTDADGTLLIGIDKRGLLQLHDGRIEPVPEVAAWAAEQVVTVWSLHRIAEGRLLMGTSVGLYERQPDRSWRPLAIPGLAAPVIVKKILEEKDGSLWLATDGMGLVNWRPGHPAQSFGTRVGMLDDSLFTVLDDGLGCFWVCSARGIGRIRESDFTELEHGTIATLNCMTFGRVDGLASAATSGSGGPAACKLADGRLLFATDRGVAVIDPGSLQTNTQPPTEVIESLVADGQSQPLHSSIVLPAGTGKLEIRFTALSLIAPERLRFRYRLIGSDPDWVEAGHERSARYTHLAPGRYTFRVLACNNDGVWSQTGATLGLMLLPHFYETWWFRSVAVLGLAALVALFIAWRLRTLNRRQAELTRMNAELDQRVTERTAELSRSHAELQQRESLFRLIFEHAPVGIAWKRTDLGPNYHVNTTFRNILDLPADTLPESSPLAGLVHPKDAPRFFEMGERVRTGRADSYTLEQRFVRPDGREVWGFFAAAVVRNERGEIVQVIEILEDITARKQAEIELAKTYKRLVEASRVAGMAEVATGVLHNVGNVLNSVNVSATLLAEGLRSSRLGSLAKLSTMLHDHAADLGTFLSEDPKGRRVLPYLDTLADHLAAEQQRFVIEVGSLRDKIEHIKEIVARQQSFAHMGGLTEKLSPVELMEDALQMNIIAFERHRIEIVRDLPPDTPAVAAERHKVLQILVNLFQNAKEAIDAVNSPAKRLHLRLTHDQDRVRFIVTDNGIGILPENLQRVFEHGFTTRRNGHGFGLHASAIAAREMHGSLTVHSDGPGRGAEFILELPLARENAPAASAPSGLVL